MISPGSNSASSHCLSTSWLGLTILLLTIAGLGAGGQCKFDLEEYETRRIAAIKGQILSKLGLTEPPTDDGPEVVPKEVMDLFNHTVELLEAKYEREREQCSTVTGASDNYFAQVPILCDLIKGHPSKDDNYAMQKTEISEFLKFDLSPLQQKSGGNEVTEAEFRVYQVPNDMTTETQQIDLFQLLPSNSSTSDLRRRYLTSWTVSTDRSGWLSHDVTDVVREWVADPESNLGFELNLNCADYLPPSTTTASSTDGSPRRHVLFAHPRGTYPSMWDSRGDNNPMPDHYDSVHYPRLILMAPANHSRGDAASVRRRRSASVDDSLCDESKPNCCLRHLTVNFRRDLRWTWIRQPRVYTPNFCAGSCPYILSADQNYASILSLYKHLNPDASPSPCCSPSAFKPLTIMFFNRGLPEIRVLNNMIIEKCRCS
ncbi:LOW QUALITY PROTEIN: transforming growth factor beta-3 proprotein-like [Diadema setosum]|uniref:LOW QUALITY PROTEIN: transforming growth factor beta-3 proprotein-like n=1 Tax=Diadema setosum TaxID=31175 RepID=UPI003B3AAC4D